MTRYSVVVPTYQRADLVGRAIESALNQTHPPAEVIVVDDGSTDDTEAIVRAFGDVITFVRQPNMGVAAARNHGSSLAASPWIAFLDSDDRWTPNHLASITTAIHATNSRAILYFADTVEINTEGQQASLFDIAGLSLDAEHVIDDGVSFAMLPVQPMMIQASVVQRDAYLAHGGMDTRLRRRQDTHFFHSFGLSGSFCAVRNTGAEILHDAPPAVRLTTAHPSGSALYIDATVTLYRDMLGRSRTLPPTPHRKEIKRRLADGLASRAKLNARTRPGSSLVDAAQSTWLAPKSAARRALRTAIGRRNRRSH